MTRLLLIFLLTVVVVRQAVPFLQSKVNVTVAELCSPCDESEGEETNKPDPKSQAEDKLHHYNIDIYTLLQAAYRKRSISSQHLHRNFYDQPATPPPNLS